MNTLAVGAFCVLVALSIVFAVVFGYVWILMKYISKNESEPD